ncbi:amidohydrolase family protein [Leifsonia sp. 2MCAF36]|uniref:amidohydrolase family protein n=1 Tax=Leifsonia sp. 2MCAF36 TaxID=3232988 RepID=UPI003F9CC9FB
MTLASTRRIDAHLHLWDLDSGGYAWLTPEHGALYSTFTAEQARAELDAAGVEWAILVQAEDTLRDTDYLLGVAKENPWVAAVVGWVPLDEPRAAEAALDRWGENPAFRGVRHLVHNDPRTDFLELAQVRSSLALLARRGLAFEVPDAWPAHLDQARDVARALPELTVVVDHLAKPPVGRDDFGSWHSSFDAVAALPNTVAKVSGLTLPGVPFTAEALRPAWDAALDLFGPPRLMYGGDWPISVQFGGYQRAWAVYSEWIGELSAAEQEHILWNTAVATYSLNDPMSRRKRVSKC